VTAMSPSDSSGTLFFVGIQGTALSAEEQDFLGQVRPGGVILFSRNVESPEQVQELNGSLGAMGGGPLNHGPLVGIDQEWGPVNRFGGLFPALPAAAALGRGADGERVGEAAALTGRLLRRLGFHINFAPVVDLSEENATNGIGTRSLGTDPEAVAELAARYLDGLSSAGVVGTIKHFPGLGRTVVDSHQVLPVVEQDREDLWRSDLLPFRRLVASRPGVPVMVGHGWYPALEPPSATDGGQPLPASLSPAVVNGLLRGELGHQGVVITDDLEMGAVTGGDQRDLFDEAVGIRALLAGVDWILICHSKERILAAREELDRELRGSAVLRRMAAAAHHRIRDLAATLEQRRAAPGPHAPVDGLDTLTREMETWLHRWQRFGAGSG
jgi:beta-N-acetylhexosaminidase